MSGQWRPQEVSQMHAFARAQSDTRDEGQWHLDRQIVFGGGKSGSSLEKTVMLNKHSQDDSGEEYLYVYHYPQYRFVQLWNGE